VHYLRSTFFVQGLTFHLEHGLCALMGTTALPYTLRLVRQRAPLMQTPRGPSIQKGHTVHLMARSGAYAQSRRRCGTWHICNLCRSWSWQDVPRTPCTCMYVSWVKHSATNNTRKCVSYKGACAPGTGGYRSAP